MMKETDSRRHLRWDACYNIRDVGGYPTIDGRQTRWRALVRADNLCRLTPHGQAALVAYGVRTIVDLRSTDELALAPHPFAHLAAPAGPLTYLHLPLLAEGDSVGAAAISDAATLQDMYGVAAATLEGLYIAILERYGANVAAIVRAVARAPEGAVLVHCHAGKDRTGLVVALLLAVAGVPPPTIAADYAASETYLQPLYHALISQATQTTRAIEKLAQQFTTSPETMRALLSFLDSRHGGVQGYLRAVGVTDQEKEELRCRLRA